MRKIDPGQNLTAPVIVTVAAAATSTQTPFLSPEIVPPFATDCKVPPVQRAVSNAVGFVAVPFAVLAEQESAVVVLVSSAELELFAQFAAKNIIVDAISRTDAYFFVL